MVILAENKKAKFNYEILEKFEAGISLLGQEVKSIKKGRASLDGSYIISRANEFYLAGATIPAYQPQNAPPDYDESRFRKLLLTKKEIKYLIGKAKQRGLTLVPLRLYTKDNLIKLEFAVCRGKRKVDKREKIRKREAEIEIRRTLKRIY
jgi:SsrA-binding protein